MTRTYNSKIVKRLLVAICVLLPVSVVFAADTGGSESDVQPLPDNPALVTTDFIDAEISLNYPGFEGLSVDSLGNEHFPLVMMEPLAKPWQPTRARVHRSRVECKWWPSIQMLPPLIRTPSLTPFAETG
jgi:hypothetical protein